MADPAIVDIPEWVWTKVATNVVTGVISKINYVPRYFQTFRLTGTAAPAAPTEGTIPEEAIQIFLNDENQAIISSNDLIDVYIMSADYDSKTSGVGKIRVDV